MKGDSELLDKIFRVTRGDLERAAFPIPDLGRLADEIDLVRVERLANFWLPQVPGAHALLQSAADLLAGLAAQGCAVVSAIVGSAGTVDYWIGCSRSVLPRPDLIRLLRGTWPDSRVSDRAAALPAFLSGNLYGAAITGIPTVRAGMPDQIERVIRALNGHRWALITVSRPLPAASVMQTLNTVTGEIREVRSTYLLKTNPLDELNRTAERYIALLEAQLARLEIGRAQGMWSGEVLMVSDDAATVRLGKGLVHAAYAGEDSSPLPIRCTPCAANTATPERAPLTSQELAAFVRPPMEEYPGYQVVEHVRYGLHPGSDGSDSSLHLGDIFDRGAKTGNAFRISRDQLTKHALITGLTGSGKTNTCISILRQLWASGDGVPFLVIESAKSEYRNLRMQEGLSDLTVLTVAEEGVAPLRLNPFAVPPGVPIQVHIDHIKSLFSAAFVLYPPMPYVLEQAIAEVYEDRGWDVALDVNRRGESSRAYPTLSDLAAKVADVIERMGYDERITMDVRAGLLARLNQLRLGSKGLMFDTRDSTPPEVLFEGPCIIELRNLVNDDEKAFLIGLLMILLYERAERNQARHDGRLHHVTLIEEAHRLLRNTSTDQNGDVANPRGRAIETFSNILTEVRAFGEGILIAEQVPSKLAPDCLKNTNLKIVHRLVADDERQLMGRSVGLDESQTRGIGTLTTGHAVAFAEGMERPVRITVPPAKWAGASVSNASLEVKGASHGRGLTCRSCERAQRRCRPPRDSAFGSLVIPFRQLFNALRFRSSSIEERYESLHHIWYSDPQRAGRPFSCGLATLGDAECDRRGHLGGWTFEAVDDAVDSLLDELDRLEAHTAPSGRFADIMLRLHSRDNLPFAGCDACEDRCQHRFEAALSGVEEGSHFRSAFLKAPVSWNSLVGVCWTGAQSTPVDVAAAHRGACLCFGVQQFHALRMTPANQRRAAVRLAKYLPRE